MINKKINNPFIVLTLAVLTILLLPQVFQEGLFMDGLIYSTLGHNLANGIGTFWFPKFSETIMAEYYEHPPLVYGIQSLFFRLMGDAFYVEKVYSFLTALLTALFIILIWKKISYRSELKNLYWLPVLLWITIPKAFWSYNNNMLENTMGLFSMAAIYFLFVSIDIKSITRRIAFLLLSAFLIFLGFLSKGFPALFPLAFFFCYFFVFRSILNIRQTILNSLILLLAFISIFLLLIGLNEPALESLTKYIETQVLESLRGERVVVSRWFIMIALLREIVIMFIVTVFMILIYYRKSFKQIKNEPKAIRFFLFFLLIGLSASVPIMISPKQLSFYIVPSLPYFAIGFSILIAHIVGNYLNRIDQNSIWLKLFRVTGYLLLSISILLSVVNYGKYCRNEEMIKDVVTIGNYLPAKSTIDISKPLYQKWGLMGYFQRKFYINLVRSGNLQHNYLLKEINEPLQAGYKKEELNLLKYQLLKKNSLFYE